MPSCQTAAAQGLLAAMMITTDAVAGPLADSTPSVAAVPQDCSNESSPAKQDFAQLKDLPPAVYSLIRHEIGAVADAGESFNATDVKDDRLPSQVFEEAVGVGKCITVQFLAGGYGYRRISLSFMKDAAGSWKTIDRQDRVLGR